MRTMHWLLIVCSGLMGSSTILLSCPNCGWQTRSGAVPFFNDDAYKPTPAPQKQVAEAPSPDTSKTEQS